jgi:ADP-ribose pyrophosphatase YjhB (NUDIX family)
MLHFEDSYTGKLRKAVGDGFTLVIPAVRAVIFNQENEVLLVKRSDNGCWSLPAGGIELGDSVMDCLRREVAEETGLVVLDATPIAIYSEPRYTFVNAYGNPHQMFSIAFLVDRWEGKILRQTDETLDARFFSLDALPDIPLHHQETLEDVRKFEGRFMVK